MVSQRSTYTSLRNYTSIGKDLGHMNKVRLFLIDIDPRFLERAAQYLSATRDVDVIGHTTDAAQGMLQIERGVADCVVLGLAQKCCCGLSLLRALRALPSQPALIVCTAFQSETAVQMCQEIGADMFLSKPVPMEQLHECIVDTSRMKRRLQAEQHALEARREPLSPTAVARRLLLSAGIPPRLFGFSCLAEALYLLHQDERRLRNLRRDLYPRVAQSLMTTPENVERNMRTAIHHAGSDEEAAKLSNRQFLLRMLRKLREADENGESTRWKP